MPQGHPTHCGCEDAGKTIRSDSASTPVSEQAYVVMRNERDGFALKWGRAVAHAESLEEQRDSLLGALEALLKHEGTVDDTGIGEMDSEVLQDARAQAKDVIETTRAHIQHKGSVIKDD